MNFEELALECFDYQSKHNKLYRQFLDIVGMDRSAIQCVEDIPCMPISFFKHHDVMTGDWESEMVFRSSGTSDQSLRSNHLVADAAFYQDISSGIFKQFYGDEGFETFALLPSYLENGESSLVFMVDHLMNLYNEGSEHRSYLYDHEELHKQILTCLEEQKRVMLWGVTFALLDFAQHYDIRHSNLHIMFTGGMKNRRREMHYDEIYDDLKKSFPLSSIDSEYGMTEMFSQSYSLDSTEGLYRSGRSLRIMCKEISDPLSNVAFGKTGQVAFCDLANVDTISFVQTDDLGLLYPDGRFRILGRMSNSDLRGCNLLYQSSADIMPS